MAGGIGGLPSSGPGNTTRSMQREVGMNSRADAALPASFRPFALREVPAAERPRERLQLRGASGLTAAELIALIWGSGSRGMNAVDLAENALSRLEGVSGLARAS